MRLIDADALYTAITSSIDYCEDILEIIDRQPSAEPVVIRCKECKWFGDVGCAIMIADDSDKPTENDYCSFVERRTDE